MFNFETQENRFNRFDDFLVNAGFVVALALPIIIVGLIIFSWTI
tara:strand:- start:664 stop:795 length:132 start_codon:yes stop_codon:yes gene_type:complete